MRTHREPRQASVYALVVGRDGHKLRKSPLDGGATSRDTTRLNIKQNGWEMSRVDMQALSNMLASFAADWRPTPRV